MLFSFTYCFYYILNFSLNFNKSLFIILLYKNNQISILNLTLRH